MSIVMRATSYRHRGIEPFLPPVTVYVYTCLYSSNFVYLEHSCIVLFDGRMYLYHSDADNVATDHFDVLNFEMDNIAGSPVVFEREPYVFMISDRRTSTPSGEMAALSVALNATAQRAFCHTYRADHIVVNSTLYPQS